MVENAVCAVARLPDASELVSCLKPCCNWLARLCVPGCKRLELLIATIEIDTIHLPKPAGFAGADGLNVRNSLVCLIGYGNDCFSIFLKSKCSLQSDISVPLR